MNQDGLISVEFGLENCEVVIVPYECFQSMDVVINADNIITHFNCHIFDNGHCKYAFTFEGNSTSPIARLAEYDDIVSICFVYEGRSEDHYVLWGDDDNFQSNERQSSELKSYKEAHIFIKDLPPSSFVKNIFSMLDVYEDDTTVKQIRDGLESLDGQTLSRIKNMPALICALRQ